MSERARIGGEGDGSAVFRRLAAMADRGEEGVLATVIRTSRSTPRGTGSKMIVHADGALTGSIGGGAAEGRILAEAAKVAGDGVCRTVRLDLTGDDGVCGGTMEVFLEPVLSALPFWVVGAGHVGRALAQLGAVLPFRFVLVDDRPEFLADLADRPGLRALHAGPAGLGEAIVPAARGAVVLVSRSHEVDGDYLEAILAAERKAGVEFGFLGSLGSRAKIAHLRRRFADDQAAAGRLDRAQIPVGLDLGAETPAEIALSVLAEAVAVLRERPLLVDAGGVPLGVRLYRRREG